MCEDTNGVVPRPDRTIEGFPDSGRSGCQKIRQDPGTLRREGVLFSSLTLWSWCTVQFISPRHFSSSLYTRGLPSLHQSDPHFSPPWTGILEDGKTGGRTVWERTHKNRRVGVRSREVKILSDSSEDLHLSLGPTNTSLIFLDDLCFLLPVGVGLFPFTDRITPLTYK